MPNKFNVCEFGYKLYQYFSNLLKFEQKKNVINYFLR